MNVFACDADPITAASHLADRHVVKMNLETAQILSTAVRVLIGDDVANESGLYKQTHKHHPITIAVIRDPVYREWVAGHAEGLRRAYLHRFGKHHKSATVSDTAIMLLQCPWRGDVPQVFPMAMPTDYKGECPYQSYRDYLNSKYREWVRQPKWTRSNPPPWYTSHT